MRSDELLEEMRKKPFEPQRMHLTDGTVYEIRHPELVMVGRSKALVGIAATGQPGVFERYDVVSLLHIVRLEPMAPAASV